MIRYFTISLLLLICASLKAQITEIPLPNKIPPSQSLPFGAKLAAPDLAASLKIPFWEDFSTSRQIPSTDRWVDSEAVRISNGLGRNAPSLNVAVFDGVDANGSPYNAKSLINGATDRLTSRKIDLSILPATQADSVYLSFFWQVNGNGELPDSKDSLVLQLKNTSGKWINVWSQKGGKENESEAFAQELIKIPQNYFHDSFQFRFISFSNQTGPFDTWLVDYILLNDSRHANDTAYLDRTLTRKPSFLIGPYSSMPVDQFFANPGRYLMETKTEFLNLNSFFQPIQFSTIVRELHSRTPVEVLNNETVASPLPGAFERRTFTASVLNSTLLDQNADSLLLETTYFIRSGDNFFIENLIPGVDTTFIKWVDYRVNDTVRVNTVIDDYFAYDDNEPDFAAGINQRGGQLAYAFFAEKKALLTHIDINFPFVQQAGTPIEVMVWSNLDNKVKSVLFRASYSVLKPSFIGELGAYELHKPVFVQDTFYIGFQQATNEFLGVGLDKNHDTGDRMYFNVSGKWQKNQFVKGSFLMRPRFDKKTARKLRNAGSASASSPNLYPNPSSGQIFVEGEITSIRVFDNQGQQGRFTVRQSEHGIWIDLGKNKKGVYLLRFLKKGRPFTKKIIVTGN